MTSDRIKTTAVLAKIFRIVLRLLFRFEPWHTSPAENRAYANDIVEELKHRNISGSVLEVGCGLGDIIGRVPCREKYFFDLSANVLRAAKFLQNISFACSLNQYRTFDFLHEKIEDDLIVDAAILVNWIHGCEASCLRKRIGDLVTQNLRPRGTLVFDVIENNPNYRFNHAVEELIEADLFEIETVSGYKFGRRLIFAKLK